MTFYRITTFFEVETEDEEDAARLGWVFVNHICDSGEAGSGGVEKVEDS